ncbi:hypothetical protein H2199_001506 [Coniosporium tulheliwenetii]|uniref:Uncharacterized protein n=1 Tax=Coniosporium tulheliwenetii TaxID=3383036 RepID=A0ACC2ZJL2_9PEZI|nr:hypothetical protein H2199_001506 [Cladosporium sp. JES 115]
MARPAAAADPKLAPQTAIAQPPASSAVQQRSRTPTEPAAEHDLPRLTAVELFENFVSQYLETLYLSKASLAYFAKGPISRVRASFAGSQDGSFQLSKLAIFYRAILHNTTSIDKKYKEKLPELLKAMPMAFCSDEEPMTSATVRRKKTKARKLKPSKDGMYPDEAEYVKKWWLSDWATPSQGDFESAEDVARKRTANLKVRETLTQLIVVMEVMALEALPACQLPQTADGPGDVESQAQRTADVGSQKRRKSKKPQDMSSIMDVLVERLCIWQSVEQEESSAKLPSRNQAGGNTHIIADGASNSDILKDFCVEVIIPFYMNRIPEKAASINRKLGGPGAPSPAKPAATHNTSTSATLRKPGEPEVRQPPSKKIGRPLQKVSSEINPMRRRPPSLARSATDSGVVPGLKREGSEIPLMAIPRQESQVRRGGSLADIKRFRQREIDLTAMTAANEAKLRKKAAVENELKTAISALKKPNRGLAVKELVDSADQRRLQNGVQVTATPKRASKTKIITQSRSALRSPPPDTADVSARRSSGACIPSSAVRPAASSLIPGSERRTSRTDLRAAVAETPSRGPAKTVSFFTDPIPQTPSRNRNAAAVFSTPVNPFATPCGIVAATPTSKKLDAVKAGVEKSIYDALGWDDDGDLG